MNINKLPCEYIDIGIAKDIDWFHSTMGRKQWHATEEGLFRLSTAKHVNWQVAEIWKNAGHLTVFDGNGRAVFKQPSVFTGSFKLDGYCENGLLVRLGAGHHVCPNVTITWQELVE